MADISNFELAGLELGGNDGGIIVAASAAQTSKVINMIECLEAATTFTALEGENQDGTARNLLTANGYAGVALPIGTKVFAPIGGFIEEYTADKITRYSKLPGSNRTQNNG
jgi:hypothetical protein